MKTDIDPNEIAPSTDRAEWFDRGERRLMDLASWLAQSIRVGRLPMAPATVALLESMRRLATEMRKLRSGDAEAGERFAAESDNARRLAIAYSAQAAWVERSTRVTLRMAAVELATLAEEVRQLASATPAAYT